MSGGGKGGSTTSSVTIPAWLEDAARQNIARADVLSTIGYTPYYGPDVAAFTPMQEAAFANTNSAANAFGMATPTSSGLPQAQNFGGVAGYSSAPLYQDSLAALQAAAPGQYAALTAPFINPVTGAAPQQPFGPLVQPTTSYGSGMGMPYYGSSTGTEGGNYGGAGGNQPMTSASGGYTSPYDMINGGGPGTSGSTFVGGPMSGTLNTIGVRPAGSGGSSSSMGSGK